MGILFTVGIADLPAHGPNHIHGNESGTVREEIISSESESGSGNQDRKILSSKEKVWTLSLLSSWESRHVHYGVDETGPSGAYAAEVSFQVERLSLTAWSGYGTGNDFQEWDFTLVYRLDIGPVFFVPGYNFRYSASFNEEEHEEEEHAHGEKEHHEEDSHSHKTYGHELFFVLGTDRIPYVTPNMVFICDLNNTPAAAAELRLDGEIPLRKNTVTLRPYALLGLNFGYNTPDYYGWNNFQFGVEAGWQVTRHISVFAGVHYSVALKALQTIEQGNVVWANAGISFSY